jgi:Flp pilus assembly pilin Flp
MRRNHPGTAPVPAGPHVPVEHPGLRERGASAVEYGLMVAAVAALIVGTVFAFGTTVTTTYQRSGQCLAYQGSGDLPAACPRGR